MQNNQNDISHLSLCLSTYFVVMISKMSFVRKTSYSTARFSAAQFTRRANKESIGMSPHHKQTVKENLQVMNKFIVAHTTGRTCRRNIDQKNHAVRDVMSWKSLSDRVECLEKEKGENLIKGKLIEERQQQEARKSHLLYT